MKSLEYDLKREFLVQGPAFMAPLEYLAVSHGCFLPEHGDTLSFAHLPQAAKIRAHHGTTSFVVDQVVLQPSYGDEPGKLRAQESTDWAPDTAVITLLPRKGEKISSFLAKCQEIPQKLGVSYGQDHLVRLEHGFGTEFPKWAPQAPLAVA